MKIVSWNINSVRLRAPIVLKLAELWQPDIICLQETKCPDELFPEETFIDAGFTHIHKHGMKGYNGVAILSRHPFDAVNVHHRVGQEDCRHIAVSVKGFDLHNLYIPAGGDVPDREENPKFGHKLDFVDEMADWFKDTYKAQKDPAVIAVGDFNIAPYEHDVWSHKQLLKVVSHTPPELERIEKMRKNFDWVDTAREFVPMDEKTYTWWSYRNRDWKKSNRGRRLDHIWATPVLKPKLKSYNVLPEARDWEKPSDHVPIMVEIDL